MCSNLPKHHCLHTLWKTVLFFTPFFCAHSCLRDLLDVSRLLALTRWRLALAQDAQRATSPSSSLYEVPNRILTALEIFYSKVADSNVLFCFADPVFHTLRWSLW